MQLLHNLLRRNLMYMAITFGLYLIILALCYPQNTEMFNDFFGILFGLILLINILPIILIFNYYSENKNIDFESDTDSNLITITQNGIRKSYHFNEVKKSNYHLAYNYKNIVDNKSRHSVIFSDFGYWDLQFKNGDRYYLSNLLKDFIHDAPIIRNTKYRFRVFPYIKKFDMKEGIKLKFIPRKY